MQAIAQPRADGELLSRAQHYLAQQEKWLLPAEALAPMYQAVRVLLEAHVYSQNLHNGMWEFAVELPSLLEAGCTRSALRWLVSQGYVEHAIETTQPNAKARSFHPVANLSMTAETCFVLTASGLALARGHPVAGTAEAAAEERGTSLPCWDVERRELRLGHEVVKRFRRPARNQEIILGAFQEDGWPPRIDNPLSDNGDTCAVDRLHEAVRRLNHQERCLLRFRSDGNGLGVQWASAGAITLGSN